MEESEARAVNLHEIVSGVMEAREPEWRRKGIRVENGLPVSARSKSYADESELEQVLLSLLIHVEHAVEDQAAKNVPGQQPCSGSPRADSYRFLVPPYVMPSASRSRLPAIRSACGSARRSRKVMEATSGCLRRPRVASAMNWNFLLPGPMPRNPRRSPRDTLHGF